MCEIDVMLLNLPTTGWYKDKFSKSNSMPPLGLLYIGTVLQQHDYTVKVVDFSVEAFSQQQFIETLSKHKPKVIGMSTYNESWKAQRILCSLIKRTLPEAVILAGGSFATFCYKDILTQTETDYVIRGEGEYSALELCDILLRNSGGQVTEVSGIVCKSANGEIYYNPDLGRIRDLNELPIPDRSLVDLNNYLVPFTINTARGCPGDCVFCSSRAFWGKKVYLRSAESIFAEVMDIYEKYGATVFYVTDDTFTASVKRALEFCRLIKQTGIHFVWGCESRADIITDRLMQELSEAGCRKIQIGLESADNDILHKLQKKVTIEQIENGIRLACKNGMHISASFIIGHAFDTEETVEKTLKFAEYIQKKYGAYVMGSINTPFPGTEQYDRQEEWGITIYANEWDQYRLNNPIISTRSFTIDRLRYYHEAVTELMSHNNSPKNWQDDKEEDRYERA